MSDKRYLGNIITQNPTAPAGNFGNSAAKGVWSLEEQLAYQKAGLWPVPGNFPVNVENVFSTYLYNGNGDTGQSINNGIDLAGEGGLVWLKSRSSAYNHSLYDTERGVQKYVESNSSAAQTSFSGSDGLNAFNSNGFTLGPNYNNENPPNAADMVSWTFRKAPKFFDVVTYTGNGTGGRTVSHSLGSVPGMIILKNISSGSEGWRVYHRGANGGTNPEQYYAMIQSTNAFAAASTPWNNTAPTSSVFTLGSDTGSNNNGDSFVAYLFAHNNSDGEFGPDADADIIKCGSYTGNGSATGPVIDLGFEPQWLLLKNASTAYNWIIVDVMRGWSASPSANTLFPNSTAAEDPAGTRVKPTSTGFQIITDSFDYNKNGDTFIYMAIRRGTKVPESATEVFAMDLTGSSEAAGTQKTTGFPVDFQVVKLTSGSHSYAMDRLRGVSSTTTESGPYLYLSSTTDEAGTTFTRKWDNTGYQITSGFGNNPYMFWNWKRASKYFDVVAYTGNGTAGRTVSHNLGVAPEMMWIKGRSAAYDWVVYHKAIGNSKILNLNESVAAYTQANFNNTDPTSSVFTVGSIAGTNASSQTFIAYLFATLAGISKVGSVTHSGTTNVDCGFTSGARFVLLKRTDATGGWYVWDSTRGIVSGNDPYFLLNANAAQVTNTDYIDPLSSGFTISDDFTDGTYIFYAIA
jgi:hypothetical protein